MYERAARVTCQTVGSTPANVGPGSYRISHLEPNQSESYAPFLSLTRRETIFQTSGNKAASPGPGQYSPSLPQNHIPGGRSLQNRFRRFEDPSTEVPGPGTYNLLPGPLRVKYRDAEGESPGKKVSKITRYSQHLDIPSIPSPGLAYGYVENQDGLLRRQVPPSRDQTLGPAFYHPQLAENSSSQKYSGVHFGKMTEKRCEVKVVEGPGPGTYSPEKSHTIVYENVNVRKEQENKAELFIPRYHEIVALQEMKKGIPGPGHYHIRGIFESPTNPSAVPFLSQAERFAPVKETAPPVGAYSDPRCALERLKKNTALKKSPFGQSATRFPPDDRKPGSPGPGSYNVFDYGMAQDSLKKACLESSRKAAFGSMAQRSLVFSKKEDAFAPGPSDYRVEKTEERYKQQQHMAVFRSGTERLAKPQAAKDTPPPSSYNVRESFEKTRGRSSYLPPRNKDARKRQASFLSTAPRTSSFHCSDPDVPGPGQYSPSTKSSPNLALMVSREVRFRGPSDETPGPGTYKLSRGLVDTVLKRTFNVTLDNPLAPHTLCTPHAHGLLPAGWTGLTANGIRNWA